MFTTYKDFLKIDKNGITKTANKDVRKPLSREQIPLTNMKRCLFMGSQRNSNAGNSKL